VCLIGAARIEGYLCVARYLQVTRPIQMIDQSDPTDFCIHVGNDRDLVTSLGAAIPAPYDGAIQSQVCFIFVCPLTCGLSPSRPDASII
jgi:hypothetical protein